MSDKNKEVPEPDKEEVVKTSDINQKKEVKEKTIEEKLKESEEKLKMRSSLVHLILRKKA